VALLALPRRAVTLVAGVACLTYVVGGMKSAVRSTQVAPVEVVQPSAEPPGDLARPVDLYALTLNEVRLVAGHRVEAFLEVVCPVDAVDAVDGFTVVAAYERPDRVERHVYLEGEHRGIQVGDKLTAEGVLRVIELRGATVNGVLVPGWAEIRIEQARANVTRSPRRGRLVVPSNSG
jgi:hypothetical protein